MTRKRAKNRQSAKARRASSSSSSPRSRASETARGGSFQYRAEYGKALPTSDTFPQWLESWKWHGTTLHVANRWKRESYRTQARLEFTDNQHAGGIARLFGLYVVGVGPRLKFKGYQKWTRREASRELLDYVNWRWAEFADDVRFASVLRQAMQTLVVDGEAFIFLGYNPKKRDGLDLRLLDSQRIGNPSSEVSTRSLQDGVYLDAFGNPYQYCVYNVPDQEGVFYRSDDFQLVPAEQIFHLFREDLAGQTRGISWFAAALPLLQQLREYTAAVIQSAKRGAKLVATIETQTGFGLEEFRDQYILPNEAPEYLEGGGGPVPLIPYDAWNVRRTDNGDTLILPPGTTQKAFDSSQPTTEAAAFTSSILGQIGYSLGLPRNKATGSSHEYNFASGRLDNQPFELLIKTLQLDIFERRCCDRLFVDFYRMIAPELFERFDDAPNPDEIEWEWKWPEPPLVDAEATARTNAIRLQSLQTTLDEVWNETHAFSEFDEVRDEILRDEKDFPNVFGLANKAEPVPSANTRIDEPKGGDVRNVEPNVVEERSVAR